jgi:hypothetical protein
MGALDRERTATRGMCLGDTKCFRVAIAVGSDRRLEHDRTATDIDDPDRVLVAMRVDTDDVVQLICDHPDRPPAQRWGTHSGAGLGMETLAARL